MTGLEFLSATIGQLVWPILIIVVVFLLREPIKQLASNPRLKRVKAGPSGLELELRDELDEAKKELGRAEKEMPPGPPSSELQTPRGAADDAALDFVAEMGRLAEVAPRAVILESHARLERLLRNSVDVPTGEDRRPRYLSMRTLTRAASSQGLINPREAGVLDELSHLRNRVAHEPDEEITKQTALEYAELTAQVAMAVRTARGESYRDGPML